MCEEIIPCPAFLCAAPPDGCTYGRPEIDANGCAKGCGELICEIPKPCPAYSCAAPPDHCSYGMPIIGPDGCAQGCGELICEDKPIICPVFGCVAPPDGCSYGQPTIGADGCAEDCGKVICPEECHTSVRALQCPDPCSDALCQAGHRCVSGRRRQKDAQGCVQCSNAYKCIRSLGWFNWLP